MSSDTNGTPCPRGHGYITSIFLAELRDIKRQLALEAPASPNEPNTTPAEPDAELVLELAAIIREVDGSNRLGAAALAQAILSHPRIGLARFTSKQETNNEAL